MKRGIMKNSRTKKSRATRLVSLGIVMAAASAASACSAAGEDEGNSPLNAEGALTSSGPIFPDDSPRESCDLNVPLTCPANATFTIEHSSNYWKGKKTETLTTPLVAAIESNRAQRMWCQAPSDFVTVIRNADVNLPRGVTAKLNADGSQVVFSKRVSALAFDPPMLDLYFAGREVCSIDCSSGGPRVKDCFGGPNDEMLAGKVTVNGTSRKVSFTGRVHGNPQPNPETNRLEISCDLALRRDFLAVNVRNRPNDVIATSGGKFVRGYDLKGTSLQSACHGLSSYTCQPANGSQDTRGLPQCISDRTTACVNTFSLPDPCKQREFEIPR
jgi:hypothetical protein